jgi:peptide/nickel transport system substrate-binding protein
LFSFGFVPKGKYRMKKLAGFSFILLIAGELGLAQSGNTLRFSLRSEPKTFVPHLVADESSEAIRYLTGGVLIRQNRFTQELEPHLASSWKLTEGGRTITFRLREGVRFSDGTPFRSEDVVYTFTQLMDPAVRSPTADSFRSSEGNPVVEALTPSQVRIRFPAPVAGMERLFDQVPILAARPAGKDQVTLGAFFVEDYKRGSYVHLARNPHYWRKDKSGRALPYLDAIRLEILQNRETELLRFRRGEFHLINRLDPEAFDRLAAESAGMARNGGASLESEFLWFNQVPDSPAAQHKKIWFQSKEFRRAISSAINRADLCRVVYRGYATPAVGPTTMANRFWYNSSLSPHPYDAAGALARLKKDGFTLRGQTLHDRSGNSVEFSVITNAGNKARERMAAMIQHDLSNIGIKLNIVTLDFASLIERITKTFQYEACLLGLTNLDPDPNSQMNVWLSSASNHQWNPNQKTPATAWEAEIDRLMREQASNTESSRRKAAFDRVQRIVHEEAPFIYLVTKNSLVAVSPAVRNARVAALHPQLFWNADELYLAPETTLKKP